MERETVLGGADAVRVTAWLLVGLAALGLALRGLDVGTALADDDALPADAPAAPGDASEEAPDPGAPSATEPLVATIKGMRVNVRVGPRIDVRPVTQLDEGTVLLVIERVPGWVGVLIPSGFPASVSGDYVLPAGEDKVRVTASNLNLRVHTPVEGKPMPGAFRDRVPFGTELSMIGRENGWVRVFAPENTRAYVNDKYVQIQGPAAEHAELIAKARSARAERIARVKVAREKAAEEAAAERLREAIGSAQQALYRLRIEGGTQRIPVVHVINRLDAAGAAAPRAPDAVKRLAAVMRQDLEAEIKIRMARKDAHIARLRGLDTPPERPPSRVASRVVVRGVIRWEKAPTWRNGGAWVLWVDHEPTHVLRLTTGLPHPVPDLKAHAAGKGPCVVRGSMPGERVFGLPVIEVREIQ